jgi:hypothetical protein
MPKNLDDIYKKIEQSNKELYRQDDVIVKHINDVDKNQEKILKDISEIKKEVKDIAFKVDTMLEILNTFTIMLTEEEDDLEENYDVDDSDESWVPKDDDFWQDDDGDEEESKY